MLYDMFFFLLLGPQGPNVGAVYSHMPTVRYLGFGYAGNVG